MDFDSFMKLADMLRIFVTPNPKAFRRDVISAEKRVALVFYYLKDQGRLRMTANTFGVSISTVSLCLRMVCNSTAEHLGPLYIKFPSTEEELQEAASRFLLKFGLPQVVGSVDGTHVPIIQTTENLHDFFCYKMKYSLNCQSICDEKGLFIDVEVRWPGSLHDTRICANCVINKKFISREIPPVYEELVPGFALVPSLLLGDPAYPLLPKLMKEYHYAKMLKKLISTIL